MGYLKTLEHAFRCCLRELALEEVKCFWQTSLMEFNPGFAAWSLSRACAHWEWRGGLVSTTLRKYSVPFL